MKKIVIILSILALTTSGFSQTIENNIDLIENKNQLFSIQKIDSITYFTLKEKVNPQQNEFERITDWAEAKEILGDLVTWETYTLWDGREIQDHISKITFRNGETFSFTEGFELLWFHAYYPQFDVLLGERGHTSDVSFNLTTGATTQTVGNPLNYVFSPSKKYLLNGHHDGDICTYYFIQKKIDGQYQTIIDLFEVFSEIVNFLFCWTPCAFWENDTTLNIIIAQDPNAGQKKLYYQIILK